MKRYVGLVMCVALVAVITSTSANEESMKVEDLTDLLYTSMQNIISLNDLVTQLTEKLAQYTISSAEITADMKISKAEAELTKREIASLKKDIYRIEAQCDKEIKTEECSTDSSSGENVVYTVIQQTSTGTHHGGTTSGAYLFTLIGTKGETSPHDCSADRSEGSQSRCSFEDDRNIGQLKAVKIENTSDDTWIFVSMAVEVDGVVAGRWHGSMTVGDYLIKMMSLNTNIGENVVYTIIQQTSTGTHHGGTTSGAYLFTLIGTEGETSPHDCSADRSEGSQSQCSFEDDRNIGKLKAVKIENTSDDTWIFVSMAVEVDGVVAGKGHGSMTVGDYLTKMISLNTNIVDGGWSEYSDWGACSAGCGKGTQTRSKTCNNPPPASGGKDCDGEAVESKECMNIAGCSAICGWGDSYQCDKKTACSWSCYDGYCWRGCNGAACHHPDAEFCSGCTTWCWISASGSVTDTATCSTDDDCIGVLANPCAGGNGCNLGD